MSSNRFKNVKQRLQQERPRIYLNKDFDAFRSELLLYSKTYFPERINDFSENSVGGLFLEMAAYVGDVMSFYLDHQFNELDLITAVETKNVEKLIRSAGVKITGAAPALSLGVFSVEVESEIFAGRYRPRHTYLPVIERGTTAIATNGTKFEVGADLDFAERNPVNGSLLAQYEIGTTDSDGNPKTYIVKISTIIKSGLTVQESFNISDDFVPFRTVTLAYTNVNEIVVIRDSEGNEYHEVEALTQDVVYKRVINVASDFAYVPENLELLPAPYRFISTMSRITGKTSIRFGSGDARTLDGDIIPDPSEVAIPLFGQKKTFSRFSIDPNSLLATRTMGISPRNTTITIVYRAGGGISHNVGSNEITSVATLLTRFQSTVPASVRASMRGSVSVTNPKRAEGGESQLTMDELRTIAISARNSQSRLVTKEDLIARIYMMPPNFGRVFRVGVRSNPNNPLAAQLAVISRDADKKLVISPDSLKINLKNYLNEFRIISDAIDVIDAAVINLGVRYSVVVDETSNKSLTVQLINVTLADYLNVENFQIDQPLVISDLINLILNSEGVVSITSLNIVNISGAMEDREYSDDTFNVSAYTKKGIVFPLEGAIFEVKYPTEDIIGYVS